MFRVKQGFVGGRSLSVEQGYKHVYAYVFYRAQNGFVGSVELSG